MLNLSFFSASVLKRPNAPLPWPFSVTLSQGRSDVFLLYTEGVSEV